MDTVTRSLVGFLEKKHGCGMGMFNVFIPGGREGGTEARAPAEALPRKTEATDAGKGAERQGLDRKGSKGHPRRP